MKLNSSIWPIVGTLTGTNTPGQSGPGNNSNDGVLYIPQTSRTGASLTETVEYHTQDTS